jgi:hypothetical protein
MKRRVCNLILLCALALALNSCGGGGGGGVGTISSTSGGTFTAVTILVDSDVTSGWTGTACGPTSTYTVLPDNVDVKFSAFTAPPGSTGNTPEQVVIDSVVIAYEKADTVSPTLPSQSQAIGQQVVLGNSVTFPVQVAPLTLKTKPPISDLVCSNTIYSYYATMVFNCHYLVTGNTFTGSTRINIKFADFAN